MDRSKEDSNRLHYGVLKSAQPSGFSMHSLLLIFNILAIGIGRQIFLSRRFDFVVSNCFAHAKISEK